jgi:hypothetical protein
MAQPVIYAKIDCDGQVEVKVNNDTGYPCTIITSTGVNETIPSTGTDVYRNYNLTSTDWVKVVTTQDATIAANKLTGTIKYITSVTTTPTPTTTPAPGCIVANTGNTSDMTYGTLSSPADGISYSNTAVTGTTTTTTTPSGGGGNSLTGGTTCAGRVTWPAYGSSNKYNITFPSSGVKQYFEIDSSTRKFYITYNGVTITRTGYSSACALIGTESVGPMGSGATGFPAVFSVEVPGGTSLPYVLETWVV